MTTRLDVDYNSKNPLLPFNSAELDRFGIRMRPAEFSRLLGCTKQAVSLWIRTGKITLGVDGLLDPRKAVAQLLRNSDPAKIRARVLQPLMRDIGIHLKRIEELETALVSVQEDAKWHEVVNIELIEQLDRIRNQLLEEWQTLRYLPPDLAKDAFCAWLDNLSKYPYDTGTNIIDYLQGDVALGAPVCKTEGEGDFAMGTEDESK